VTHVVGLDSEPGEAVALPLGEGLSLGAFLFLLFL